MLKLFLRFGAFGAYILEVFLVHNFGAYILEVLVHIF